MAGVPVVSRPPRPGHLSGWAYKAPQQAAGQGSAQKKSIETGNKLAAGSEIDLAAGEGVGCDWRRGTTLGVVSRVGLPEISPSLFRYAIEPSKTDPLTGLEDGVSEFRLGKSSVSKQALCHESGT